MTQLLDYKKSVTCPSHWSSQKTKSHHVFINRPNRTPLHRHVCVSRHERQPIGSKPNVQLVVLGMRFGGNRQQQPLLTPPSPPAAPCTLALLEQILVTNYGEWSCGERIRRYRQRAWLEQGLNARESERRYNLHGPTDLG